MVATRIHKTFVSFHHEDEYYKNIFCRMMGNSIVDKSVDDGDIDPYGNTETIRQKIRDDFSADATVTVALVGTCTWQRKHVDWEIGSSLRNTKRNARCGLLGILLPTHPDFEQEYSLYRVPPRLADNCGGAVPFAHIYHWPDPWNTSSVQQWIHWAFQRRMQHVYNSRPQFGRNRSGPCRAG